MEQKQLQLCIAAWEVQAGHWARALSHQEGEKETGQPGEEKGPLSLENIRAWLDKAMAGLIQNWGFPLGSDTSQESFQLRFLGRKLCFSVDVQG